VSISVLLAPAPGWYPDPAGIAPYRWWDGDTWTEGTHAGLDIAPELVEPKAVVTAAPASALVAEFGSALKPPIKLFPDEVPALVEPAFAQPAAAQPAPTLPSFAELAFDQPAFVDPAFAVDPGYLAPVTHTPIAQKSTRAAAARPSAPAKTRWSSMLFAFPFVYPIVVGMIVALGYAGGAASSTVALAVIAGVAAIGGLVPAWVFADNDRRELVARGYEPTPSIAWMLVLPPIAYLLARRRVVGPSY
jgi:Protein of unknown function (DUF2510)